MSVVICKCVVFYSFFFFGRVLQRYWCRDLGRVRGFARFHSHFSIIILL